MTAPRKALLTAALRIMFLGLAFNTADSLALDAATPPPRQSNAKAFFAAGTRHGIFSGGFSPGSASKFEDWLGRKSDFNVEFLTQTAYTDYVGSDGKKITDALSHSGWLVSTWSQTHRSDRNMMFSIPLATKQDSSLAHVAEGTYDATFVAIAKSIAAAYPQAIIRIGWEFNGDWYPWSAKGRERDYVNAFRHVVSLFRQESPEFVIDWCPTHGFSGKMPADAAYPGDDAVDVIGMDVYNDYRWGNFKDDPQKRWEWYEKFDHGLEWQVHFARAHNKRLSFPEWGVNRDDPIFIREMHSWINSHDFAYEAYWDSNSAFSGMLSRNQYPEAGKEYQRLFGAN